MEKWSRVRLKNGDKCLNRISAKNYGRNHVRKGRRPIDLVNLDETSISPNTFDDDLPPKAIMKRTPSDFGENHDPRWTRTRDLTHAALREPDSAIALAAVDAADKDDIINQYRSLLHVAAMRGMQALRISWSGAPTNLIK